MSWRDRSYAPEPETPQLRIQFRRPSSAVMWLLIVNVVIFFLDVVFRNVDPIFVHRYFGLSLDGIRRPFIWQIFTYMFLHLDHWHLLLNMLGLYIFGTEFERAFGHQRFLQFYVTCGMVGGLAYLLLAVIAPRFAGVPLIGASGAIYGLLIAAVVFFPHVRVVLFIFPMPIRVFALIVAGILLLQLISPGKLPNPGGEVCHIAGAATGLALFWAWGMLPRIRVGVDRDVPGVSTIGRWRARRREGAWAKRQQEIAREQTEVDRILAKVHSEGLASLSSSEKKLLARATRRQQEREREADRADRL